MLTDADRDTLADLAPVLRRAVALDARSLARLLLRETTATALVRLPFGVLVSRTVQAATRDEALDQTVGAADTIAWLDGERDDPPPAQDAQWRAGLPPERGWASVEQVPDDVIRPLVRQGALTLKDAAAREGVPGAQPRAEVADRLLDAIVLQVSDDAGRSADVTLRTLSALTRMGFLPRGGSARVDVVGRWTRVVGQYGTVFHERPGGLTLAR